MANPNTIDWLHYQDIQIPDVEIRKQFNLYISNGQYVEAIGLLNKNKDQLKGKAFIAETINKIVTGLLFLENKFDTGVYIFLSDLAKQYMMLIDSFKKQGTWVATTQYIPYNFVVYNAEIYMCIDSPPVGTEPTNATYWIKIGLQGEVGQNGVDVNMRYAWQSNRQYVVNDVVSFNGVLYVAIAPNTNSEPATSPNKWTVFLAAIKGGIIVSNVEPSEPSQDTIWFKTQSDPKIYSAVPIMGKFHRYSKNFGWEEMYPMTIFSMVDGNELYQKKVVEIQHTLLSNSWQVQPPTQFESTKYYSYFHSSYITNNSTIKIFPSQNLSKKELVFYSELNITVSLGQIRFESNIVPTQDEEIDLIITIQ